jgi:hypothetical protein
MKLIMYMDLYFLNPMYSYYIYLIVPVVFRHDRETLKWTSWTERTCF